MQKILLTGVLVMACSVADAGVISQTQSYTMISTLQEGGGGFALPVFLDTFDPALGNLTSVDIEVTGLLNFISIGLGGVAPAGFPYFIDINVDYAGLNFSSALLDPFYVGIGPGTPFPFDSTSTIDYASSLTATTDRLGFAPVTDKWST